MAPKRKNQIGSSSRAPTPPTVPQTERPKDLVGNPEYLTEVDWSKYIISPIRNQIGEVCLDTAGIETLEGNVNIVKANDHLKALTDQQRDLGLDGWETIKKGFISLAPQDVINNTKKPESGKAPNNFSKFTRCLKDYGVCLEKDCPYTGKNPDKNRAGAKVSKRVPKKERIVLGKHEDGDLTNEQKLIHLLQTRPVAAILDATKQFHDLSEEDIYREEVPRRPEQDQSLHAVTIVGYGTTVDDELNPVHFWKIRNSYGNKWADKGYTKILRACSSNQKSVFLTYWVPMEWNHDAGKIS